MMLIACMPDGSKEVVATAIKLSKKELTLEKGSNEILTVTFTPSNVTDKTLTWVSSNKTVAEVTDGIVVGVDVGSTEIVVKHGDLTDKCTVMVKEAEVPVTGVTLDITSLTMTEGDTQVLTATISPDNASDKSVTWSSSNAEVATVSSSGVVAAIKAGSATITVTTTDGGKTATCVVTANASSGQYAVDLGLPSGLKWGSCNIGALKPEEYGEYYAWGETNTKSNYYWSTYKWSNGSSTTFVKYNMDSYYGTVDNKTVLDLEDDVAHVKLGGKWRMPTDGEWTELREKCTWAWMTQNGVYGRKVTGPNGNSFFLPAAGSRYDASLYDEGSYGGYWSSSLSTDGPHHAFIVEFDSEGVYMTSWSRCDGFSVRPVYGDVVSVSSVSLNTSSLTMTEGETQTLTATVKPDNAADKYVTWSSSNTTVATVSASGLITANKAGNATITVKANSGGKTAMCVVTVKAQGAIDLGLPSGIKWASCNIGSSSPEEYGDYYAWGEIETKSNYSWSTYKWCNGSYSALTKYNVSSSCGTIDNKTVLELEDDVAHVKLGGKWRMATDAEWVELWAECTWTWTTRNGVYGKKVTGPNGNSIFLPAAGLRRDTNLYSAGSYGGYWSSSLDTDLPVCAWPIYFSSNNVIRNSDARWDGRSVRPVSE